MTAKITLELDDKLKEAAEKVAAMRGQSIDQMLKGYLESVVDNKDQSDPLERIREIMKGKTGPLDFDWKEDRAKYLSEKHGF